MPLAGRIAIDATVKPSRAQGIIVHAATQADAEQALALLLKKSEALETLDVHYCRTNLVGALARRRPQGQIDHPLNGVGRQRGLARLARLVAQQPSSTPSAMNRACQVHTTGFDLVA